MISEAIDEISALGEAGLTHHAAKRVRSGYTRQILP